MTRILLSKDFDLFLASIFIMTITGAAGQNGCTDRDIKVAGNPPVMNHCFRGQWRTVCCNGWSHHGATLACNQLRMTLQGFRCGRLTDSAKTINLTCNGVDENMKHCSRCISNNSCLCRGLQLNCSADTTATPAPTQESLHVNTTDMECPICSTTRPTEETPTTAQDTTSVQDTATHTSELSDSDITTNTPAQTSTASSSDGSGNGPTNAQDNPATPAVIAVVIVLLVATITVSVVIAVVLFRKRKQQPKQPPAREEGQVALEEVSSPGQYSSLGPDYSTVREAESATYDKLNRTTASGNDIGTGPGGGEYDRITRHSVGMTTKNNDYDVIGTRGQSGSHGNKKEEAKKAKPSEDEFYNAEEHTYSAVVKKNKNKTNN